MRKPVAYQVVKIARCLMSCTQPEEPLDFFRIEHDGQLLLFLGKRENVFGRSAPRGFPPTDSRDDPLCRRHEDLGNIRP